MVGGHNPGKDFEIEGSIKGQGTRSRFRWQKDTKLILDAGLGGGRHCGEWSGVWKSCRGSCAYTGVSISLVLVKQPQPVSEPSSSFVRTRRSAGHSELNVLSKNIALGE
jgi:hypothetical protein